MDEAWTQGLSGTFMKSMVTHDCWSPLLRQANLLRPYLPCGSTLRPTPLCSGLRRRFSRSEGRRRVERFPCWLPSHDVTKASSEQGLLPGGCPPHPCASVQLL